MTFEKRKCPRCEKESSMWHDDKICWLCRENEKIDKISERVKEEGESSCEDYIMCPYCGDNYGEDDMHESTDVQCYKCNKKFHIEVEYSVSYSTNKIEEVQNEKVQHD